jgi:transposase-like protein
MATRDAARERFWRDTFTAWKAGGLTARDYCARHGLAATAFHHWRRELRRRDAAAPPRPSVPKFVAVTVVPAPTVAVEVRCPSGHVVTLPAVDGAALRTLFAALAPVPPC